MVMVRLPYMTLRTCVQTGHFFGATREVLPVVGAIYAFS